jgi:hypothetical protein
MLDIAILIPVALALVVAVCCAIACFAKPGAEDQ